MTPLLPFFFFFLPLRTILLIDRILDCSVISDSVTALESRTILLSQLATVDYNCRTGTRLCIGIGMI